MMVYMVFKRPWKGLKKKRGVENEYKTFVGALGGWVGGYELLLIKGRNE